VFELDQSLKSLVIKIACYYSVDLKAARKKSNAILSRSLNPPLPFSVKLLLVPFKMRCPRFPKDGATGYINLTDYAEAVPLEPSEGRPRTLIRLKNGQSLGCYHAFSKCQQLIRDAKLIKQQYLTVQGQSAQGDPGQLFEGEVEKWQRLDKQVIIFLANNDTDDTPDDE